MTDPIGDVRAFLESTLGKVVAVGGVLFVLVGAGMLSGLHDARHPRVHIANVFSTPLEVRAGTQTQTLPAHGSVTFELADKDAPIVVSYGGREIDRFASPRFHVLNVLGAAPIVRQEVVWTTSKKDPTKMDGTPKPTNTNYCGAEVIDEMNADDILAQPEEIVVQSSTETVTRRWLGFPRSASPLECAEKLAKQGRAADAERIRAFASGAGDPPPQ
jgi:hypothetical protein